MSKLIVFLGNKLISTDTFVPIALTLKAKNKNLNIDFYCFNRDTEEAIKNNTVLYDIIKALGHLKRIGDYRNSFLPNIFKKIYLFFNLILLVFSNYIFKCKYVHFGALEKWPLNILYYFNSSRTVFIESNCWGWEKIVFDIADIKRKRNNSYIIKSAEYLASFSMDWPALSNEANKNIKKFNITPSRLWPEWINYLDREESSIWLKECKKLNIDSNSKVVVFILGWLGPLDFYNSENSGLLLLENTLQILRDLMEEYTILVKPHPNTNIKVLNNFIKKNNIKNICFTNLHVSLLSRKSLFVICNYFSMSLIDAHYSKTTTIEYSSYNKKALKITNNKSVISRYVSYFINDDPEMLRDIIREIKKNNININLEKRDKANLTINDERLIKILAS